VQFVTVFPVMLLFELLKINSGALLNVLFLITNPLQLYNITWPYALSIYVRETVELMFFAK